MECIMIQNQGKQKDVEQSKQQKIKLQHIKMTVKKSMMENTIFTRLMLQIPIFDLAPLP